MPKYGRPADQLLDLAHRHYVQWATGDASETEFALEWSVGRIDEISVFVSGALMRPSDRGTAYDYAVRGITAGYDGDANRVRFTVAPGNNENIAFFLVGG